MCPSSCTHHRAPVIVRPSSCTHHFAPSFCAHHRRRQTIAAVPRSSGLAPLPRPRCQGPVAQPGKAGGQGGDPGSLLHEGTGPQPARILLLLLICLEALVDMLRSEVCRDRRNTRRILQDTAPINTQGTAPINTRRIRSRIRCRARARFRCCIRASYDQRSWVIVQNQSSWWIIGPADPCSSVS